MKNTKPKVGISGCLLGHAVRFNSGHTQDKWIVRSLSQYVDFVPICPEVEMGLGTPREEIQLVRDHNDDLLLESKETKKNLNQLASSTYNRINSMLKIEELDGFILMKKSPSCGLGTVNIRKKEEANSILRGNGFFANNLESHFPNLPKMDSGKMNNEVIKENFIKNIYAHHRFSHLEIKIKDLQEFHRSYKYLLMEHNQDEMRLLGRIAANRENKSVPLVFKEYKILFFNVLSNAASIENRFNVLQHLMGYFKKELTSEEKVKLLGIFEDFKKGLSPFLVSQQMVNFFVHKYSIDYLKDVFYFDPYPKELNLARIL